MKVGDVVTVRVITNRRNQADGTLQAEVTYQAPTGELFALLLIGTQRDGAEDLDPNEVLRSLGWTLASEVAP